MPREDWGGKKRSREKGGGRKEIRVMESCEGGWEGWREEGGGRKGQGTLGGDRRKWGGREEERGEEGCGQMSRTREKTSEDYYCFQLGEAASFPSL